MAENAKVQQSNEEQRKLSTNPTSRTDLNPARPQKSGTASHNANASTIWRADHGRPRPNRPTASPLRQSRPSQTGQPLPRPQYSLAGNSRKNSTTEPHALSYVDPKYYELNPGYQKPQNLPVWGLAKPLPRVVRSGMRRKSQGGVDAKEPGKQGVVEDTNAEVEEPGSAEAIPQVGMIDNQREEEGKERTGWRSDIEERGYGHQRDGSTRSEKISKLPSGTSAGHYLTPKDEKSNPMDEWLAKQPSRKSDAGDLGGQRIQRLPSVHEAPSRARSATTTVSRDFAEAADQNRIDLEAGDQYNDEWGLEKEEADQYVQEEWEMHNGWASFRARFREPLAECLAVSGFFQQSLMSS